MEESPKSVRASVFIAKQAPPTRPPDHPPVVTPSRLPGQASSPSTAPSSPTPFDRPKSVALPPRPQAPPPHPPSSTASPSTAPSSQPKLPPKNIIKFPPKPNVPAPSPPSSHSPTAPPRTETPLSASSPILTPAAPAHPPTLQPKQPKQHVAAAPPTTNVVTPTSPPTAQPIITPTSPPLSQPIVTPTSPPTSTPTATPTITPTPTPTPTPASPPTIRSTTPPNGNGTASPPSPSTSGSSLGIQARIQAMAAQPQNRQQPMAKPPPGAVPLPSAGGNPKVPAKPSNINGRLVSQRSSQMVNSLDVESEKAGGVSRSKLAGFYQTPEIPVDGNATDGVGAGGAATGAGSGVAAPSHIVPPPKPSKPKFVDLQLTSAQIASAQISSSQVSAQLTIAKEGAPHSKLNTEQHSALNKALSQPPPASSGQSKFFDNKTLKRSTNVEKPVRESVSDSILVESKKVDDEKVFYQDMVDRIGKQTLAHGKSVDTSQHLAQLIRDHGSRSIFASQDPIFGKCLMQAGEVLRFTEVLRSQITLMWQSMVLPQANDFIMNDIDETLGVKSRVESLKNSLDATNAKLKSMTTKGKVNLVKLSDLRRERDALIIKYKEEKARTLPTLLSTNQKHTTMLMGTMCDVLSEYSKFFDQGENILANINSDVSEYRVHIAKLKERYAREQEEAEAAEKDDEDDDFVPKDEATFSDVLSKALMDSERIYQAQLDSVVKVYLQSILSDGTLFSEIVKEDVTAIFGNIEVLADVERKLQDALLQDSSNLSTESISRTFANFTNVMSDVYSQYIKNHNRAQDTLEQCKKKSKIFCNTLKSCEARDYSPEKADLASLLSIPLERLNQYEAYFREISKKEHDEGISANITQVLECLSGLAAAAADATNQAKIKSILEVVHMNTDPNASDLTSGVMGVISGAEKPSLSPEEAAKWYARKYIREGPLNLVEQNAEKKAIKEYYFFLFNDVLVGVKRAGLPRSMGGSVLGFLKGKVHAKYLWEINNAIVSDMPNQEGLQHCISLTIMGKTYILSAESEDAKQFWIFEITKALDQIEKRKMFGVPLEELMNQTTEAGRDVPSFFEKALEFILQNAIEEEGIFRLSGSAKDIEKIRLQTDQGLEPSFYGMPYHNVSGVFKLFIRSLPVPLVTYELYNSFFSAARVEPRSEKIRLIKAAAQQLPKYHKYILQYLMYGLNQISQHVGKNKMTPYNLSIVFGPHVLKKRESDPVAELTDSKTVYDIMQLLIEDHDTIFSEIAVERENVRRIRAQKQLELAQKNKAATKQFKYEPSVIPTTSGGSQPDDEDDEDEENDAKLQGITISLKEIVKQGFLQKKGANRRNWTSRWFVLKHKYLFYFKNQKDQTPKGMISLVGVKVSPSDRKPYCFAISSANREEADEWLVAVRSCSTD